ncbi:hypothetical protein BH24ACT5_BH24ACT5_00320 [soil metagenome]
MLATRLHRDHDVAAVVEQAATDTTVWVPAAGGSNSYRNRLWKLELARLAADAHLTITVCHFPPGTSKFNKIEHRLWSQVTSNWRGQPLTSREVVVNLIGSTTTRTGLSVHAELDDRTYPSGIKVSNEEMAAIRPRHEPHAFHGDWNYTLRPPPRSRATAM